MKRISWLRKISYPWTFFLAGFFFVFVWSLPGLAHEIHPKELSAKSKFELKKIATGFSKDLFETAYFWLSRDGKKVFYRYEKKFYRMNANGDGSPEEVPFSSGTYPKNISDDGNRIITLVGDDYYSMIDINANRILPIQPCYIYTDASGEYTHCLNDALDDISPTISGNGAYVFFYSAGSWYCTFDSKTRIWNCEVESYTRKLWRVSSDDPTNSDSVNLWIDSSNIPTSGTSGLTKTSHDGDKILLVFGDDKIFYSDGKNSINKLPIADNARYSYGRILFSSDGNWVVYPIDDGSGTGADVGWKAFDVQNSTGSSVIPVRRVIDMTDDATWLLVDVQGTETGYKTVYKLMKKDGAEEVVVTESQGVVGRGVLRYANQCLSSDGNTVLFYGVDDHDGTGTVSIYVATPSGQCSEVSENRKDLRTSKDYEGLPKETKEIMTDDCLTDAEKLDKVTNLVKGWLDEYHVSVSDLKNYIIPSIAVTKELENGYKIFDSLPNSEGTGTTKVTPYFRTLADVLRKRKLTSSFIDKIDNYCSSDNTACQEVVLRKVLYLCGTTISAPKNSANFITKTCRNIEENIENPPTAIVKELAEKTREAAFGSPAYDFFTFFFENLLSFIPVGKILTIAKKGVELFGSAAELYSDMTADDTKVSTYTYSSTIDKKDYGVLAAVMKVPNAAKVQVLISRGQEENKTFKPDGYGIFLNLPVSIRTGGSNDSPEYLVFNYTAKTDIYKQAKKYLKSIEEKGYTSPKRIDYFDYDSARYNSVIELKP